MKKQVSQVMDWRKQRNSYGYSRSAVGGKERFNDVDEGNEFRPCCESIITTLQKLTAGDWRSPGNFYARGRKVVSGEERFDDLETETKIEAFRERVMCVNQEPEKEDWRNQRRRYGQDRNAVSGKKRFCGADVNDEFGYVNDFDTKHGEEMVSEKFLYVDEIHNIGEADDKIDMNIFLAEDEEEKTGHNAITFTKLHKGESNEQKSYIECVDAGKQNLSVEEAKKEKMEPSGQTKNKITLDYMAEEILKKVTIICHDGNLYQYTGKSYKIIKDNEELLSLIRSKVSHDAFGSVSTRGFSDLLTFLKADSRLVPKNYKEKILKSQYYISFRNGILDLKTMKLKEHSEKYLVFYELNAEWKQNAKPERFLEFLKVASGNDKSIVMRIEETLGYLLSAVNEGKYFFVMGTAPDSGKSTLATMLENFVGETYIAHLSTYQMGNRFSLGNIHGKTLNISMDLPNGKLAPVTVSLIKQITGGDVITTERKFETMRDVRSNMRFLFASNYPITVSKEDGDSFWNRMIIIPFQYSVEKKDMDYNLLETLMKEKDDIISLCLQAFHIVLRRGCIFSECQIAEEMKKQWRKPEEDLVDTLKNFVKDCIHITGDEHDSIYAQDFYHLYKKYCQSYKRECMDYNKVIAWCSSNMPDCERKRIHHTGENPKSGYTGMKLADD